jgi:hypothetical protein
MDVIIFFVLVIILVSVMTYLVMPSTKTVIFNNKKYKVGLSSYGYTSQRLIVNGRVCSIHIDNKDINNINRFCSMTEQAILEYENEKVAERNFKRWDGSI